MSNRNLKEELNIKKQCEDYGVPLRKCPQFLFLIMGVIIIVAILLSYSVLEELLGDPLFAFLVVLAETALLFIIGYSIISGFEKIAEANQMKSDFIDLIVHQLRTPLTTLKWGFDDLKEDLDLDEDKEEFVDDLRRNVEKMSEMANNLLLVSKIDSGDHEFEKKKFSITETVEEVLKDYLVDKDNSIEVNKKIDEDVPEKIKSNPSHVKIVVDNFVSNAIKYTPEGGQVEVGIFKKNKKVLVEVEDDGIGIPKEEQDKVFAKFERASNADNMEDGSGLGLFMTKKIVEELGGKIGFKSEEGEGSTFWFKLPVEG